MIISINKGGLSNRIKALVSCMRYANEKGIQCGVLWKVLNDYNKDVHILNCEYRELFDIPSVSNISKNCEDILYYDTTYLKDRMMIFDRDGIPNGFSNFNSNCSKKFVPVDRFQRDIDYMYTKIPKNVIENYLPYFKLLKLTKELKQNVEDFASANFNAYTVSVHIRSWNRNGESGRRNYLFDVKKFEDAIEAKMVEMENNGIMDYKFFLTTDSMEVRNYFAKNYAFKKKLVMYPRETSLNTSRDFPEGIKEDLIELFLLGKNNSLIGSHFSSYSEVAWWLAGCPNDVLII